VAPSTDRRTVTRLDPETRRTQILAAAASVLERHDPVEVRFEEIAEAAGVSRGLLYNYFGDRAGLLAAVYAHNFDAVREHVLGAIDPAEPPEVQTRKAVDAYVGYAVDHPGAWRLLHVARSNEYQAVTEARSDRMGELAALWGAGTAARIVASAIVGALESATVDWLRSPGDVDADRLAAVLYQLLWNGLRTLREDEVRW
jgi:AcrR family transcriptional regulator